MEDKNTYFNVLLQRKIFLGIYLWYSKATSVIYFTRTALWQAHADQFEAIEIAVDPDLEDSVAVWKKCAARLRRSVTRISSCGRAPFLSTSTGTTIITSTTCCTRPN